MPRKKKEETSVEAPVKETPVEAPAANQSAATKAVVYTDRGVVERVFTKEKHGALFADLAKEFASNPKRAGFKVEVS